DYRPPAGTRPHSARQARRASRAFGAVGQRTRQKTRRRRSYHRLSRRRRCDPARQGRHRVYRRVDFASENNLAVQGIRRTARRRARMPSRHRSAHAPAENQNRQHCVARAAHQCDPLDRGSGADGDDGGAVDAYRARFDFGASRRRLTRACQRQAPSPRRRETRARGTETGVMMHNYRSIPKAQGLYDPAHEHDACGVGFVVNIKGERSHDIVAKALQVLDNLTHRGACGCDPRTGDGAGILLQIPHEFFSSEAARLGFELPAPGEYGVGQVFLPLDPVRRKDCEDAFERIVDQEGQRLLGWRDVPVVESACGDIARRGMPAIRQVFIARSADLPDAEALERKLYVIRKRAASEAEKLGLFDPELFYFCSLSALTVVYKGQLISTQLPEFFPDLLEPSFKSALAMVHQRFSTNTFPSWDRAHPYRFMSHNGEINTLRGNINWMHAREKMFSSPLFGDDIKKLLPIVEPNGSDSAMFDNCLELLIRTGRSLPHSVMMMIPEAWQNDAQMSDSKRAFYHFHSCMMEPWDGPASIAFTDGIRIGAVLDRNGLRPSRYTVTKDGLVVMASETGVLEIAPENVAQHGRLQPGKMFLIDTALGRIVQDEEIKQSMAARQPYREWLDRTLVSLESLPAASGAPAVECFEADELLKQQQSFGYTIEDLKMILAPMATNGQEPVGSMGTDTPLAVLSNKPQPLYNYFKQLFAQVTNPPIDPIREELVTSTATTIGAEHNLFEESPRHCRQLQLEQPILTNEELERIKRLAVEGLRTVTLSTLYRVDD